MTVYVPNPYVEREKEKIIAELVDLYDRVDDKSLTDRVRAHYRKEVLILERMYKALEEKGYYTTEDVLYG